MAEVWLWRFVSAGTFWTLNDSMQRSMAALKPPCSFLYLLSSIVFAFPTPASASHGHERRPRETTTKDNNNRGPRDNDFEMPSAELVMRSRGGTAGETGEKM